LALLRKLGWSDAWIIHFRKAVPVPYTIEKAALLHTAERAPVYTVQVIATTNEKEAESLQKTLTLLNVADAVVIHADNFWKVHVGKYTAYDRAEDMLKKIREMGFYDSWVTSGIAPEPAPAQPSSALPEKKGDVASVCYIAVFTASDETRAKNEARRLYLLTEEQAEIISSSGSWTVRLGPYSGIQEASDMLKSLVNLGFRSSRIVK